MQSYCRLQHKVTELVMLYSYVVADSHGTKQLLKLAQLVNFTIIIDNTPITCLYVIPLI